MNLVLSHMTPEPKYRGYGKTVCSYPNHYLPFVKMLLSDHTVKFHMDTAKLDEEETRKLWSALPTLCPNLEVIMHDSVSLKIPIEHLVKLKKLTSILLPKYMVDDDSMEKISQTFPNLR
jgi:hypothetical protein